MSWERSVTRFIKPTTVNPGDILQDIDVPLRGLEMALKWMKTPKMIEQDVVETLKNMESHIDLRLQQVRLLVPFHVNTAQETKVEGPGEPILNLATISPNVKDLHVFFFLFCMRLLRDGFPVCCNPTDLRGNSQKVEEGENALNEDGSSGVCKRGLLATAACQDFIFALKCSISLGLAVFLGLHYAKDSAFWSGLTIAISFVTTRQPAFNVANARAQGTALGSVYGVLGCYIVQNHKKYRFVLLLPWIIIISFLRRSRMFGEAWGISAAIGGLLILGRNNYYQPPNVFAITRITEAVIGLSCFILVELLLQPKRASTLAKIQVSNCLQSFQESVQEIRLCPVENPVSSFPSVALTAKQNKLKVHVEELERFIKEADVEPNFWFLPFNSCIYQKLLNSLAKTVDLLSFVACISEAMLQISQRLEASSWMEFQVLVNEDLKHFNDKLHSSLTGLEDVMSIKSIAALEKAVNRKATQTDIESGKPVKNDFTLLSDDQEAMNGILSSLIGRSAASITAREIQSAEGDQKLQNQTNLCLGSLGFCISSLMQEVSVMETEIKELVRWENPCELVDLHAISSKVNSLNKSIKVSYTSAADYMTSISTDRPFLGSIML